METEGVMETKGTMGTGGVMGTGVAEEEVAVETKGDGDGGRGGRGLSVTTRTDAGRGISSGNNSEMTEGEPIEPGRGTSSGKSSERTDAAATGGDMCTNGLGGDLDSTEGVLIEGEWVEGK